jgi:hypothetical protein
MTENSHCELCGRAVSMLTRHHLIPRTGHSNKRNKRDFAREDVKKRIAWFCRPCHNQIHALFTEKTLEREYNTLESLQTHPEIAKFVAWIQKKPHGFGPSNRASAGKREKLRSNSTHW